MTIVIFSGTTEGKQLSRDLARLGAKVLVSVATEYGRIDQGEETGVEVHAGRLDADEMTRLLQGKSLCIDATHPYATDVTANIRDAAKRVDVPCKRLLRPASTLPQGCLEVNSIRQAVAWLQKKEGNILLTTGAKELAGFTCLGV